MAAKTPTARLPNAVPTIAPHHAAPTVCAMVLIVRIAAMGSSISDRRRERRLAPRTLSFFRSSSCVGVIE